MSTPNPVVLTLRPGEAVRVGEARIVIQSIPDNRVTLVIEAPAGVEVVREERR